MVRAAEVPYENQTSVANYIMNYCRAGGMEDRCDRDI